MEQLASSCDLGISPILRLVPHGLRCVRINLGLGDDPLELESLSGGEEIAAASLDREDLRYHRRGGREKAIQGALSTSQ
jgi:hypothetical protein